MLVEKNPSYFYNILPYAYVLNVTDKWAKNFEDLTIEPPSWYIYDYDDPLRYGRMNSIYMVNHLTHSMDKISSQAIQVPSSSGSGGFGDSGFGGGGGFSGGGGGGGGGGSW